MDTATRLSYVLFGCGALAAFVARADFDAAMQDYNAGNLDAAHAQFLQLAELGDCSSQFNLGAMTLKGQGVPKDRGAGIGWLQAAVSNGCGAQVGDKLPGMVASLTPEQTSAAAAVLARYGHDALRAQGVVDPSFECPGTTPAVAGDTPTPDYPRIKGGGAPEAIVLTAITVGTDGRPRDPQVLLAVPPEGFPASAVEAWLNSRFTPALRSGAPVESRLVAKLRFVGSSGNLAAAPAFKSALPQAALGKPPAEYIVGATGSLDSGLGITAPRAGQMLLDAARAGNADAQYWIGTQLRAAAACHPQADGMVWLRHAAAGGNPAAQVDVAAALLRGSPTPEQVSAAHGLLVAALASGDYYARKHAVALLATSPVTAVRDAKAALGGALQLLAGEIQSDPQMFEAVAAAYAANREYGDAVSQQRVAINKARALGWDTAIMEQRLSAYRGDSAWQGDLYAGR